MAYLYSEQALALCIFPHLRKQAQQAISKGLHTVTKPVYDQVHQPKDLHDRAVIETGVDHCFWLRILARQSGAPHSSIWLVGRGCVLLCNDCQLDSARNASPRSLCIYFLHSFFIFFFFLNLSSWQSLQSKVLAQPLSATGVEAVMYHVMQQTCFSFEPHLNAYRAMSESTNAHRSLAQDRQAPAYLQLAVKIFSFLQEVGQQLEAGPD